MERRDCDAMGFAARMRAGGAATGAGRILEGKLLPGGMAGGGAGWAVRQASQPCDREPLSRGQLGLVSARDRKHALPRIVGLCRVCG
ncbi:hypothetical protein D3C81_1246990 [compost metagenome]